MSSAREVAEQLRTELEVYIIRHSTGLVLNEPALYHIQQALEAYAASEVQAERERLAQKAELASVEDAGNTAQYKKLKYVAAWLRRQG